MTSPQPTFANPDDLDMEDRLAYCIGALVMHWGACENIFYGFVEALAGRVDTDNGAVVWLSTRNNRDRLTLVVRLAKVQNGLSPALRVEVADLCRRFRSVTKVRNFFCHATYEADAAGELVWVAGNQLTDEEQPLKYEQRALTKGLLNEITKAAKDTAAIHRDAWTLLIKLKAELKSPLPVLPPELPEYLDRLDRQRRP